MDDYIHGSRPNMQSYQSGLYPQMQNGCREPSIFALKISVLLINIIFDSIQSQIVFKEFAYQLQIYD